VRLCPLTSMFELEWPLACKAWDKLFHQMDIKDTCQINVTVSVFLF
jgi:hypothetical protein